MSKEEIKDPTPQEVLTVVVDHIVRRVTASEPTDQIVEDLNRKGLNPEKTAELVAQVKEHRDRVYLDRGRKNMLLGGLFCLGGILITALTWTSVASQKGTVILCAVAVLIGAIQFIHGLRQVKSVT